MNMELMEFCAGAEGQERFCRPWAHEEHTWATDGSIVVRVPRREEDSEIVGCLPNLAKLTFDHALIPPEFWRLLTEFALGEQRACSDVVRHVVATKYLRLIASLPVARIAPEASLPHTPVRFKFAGGLGLVMPMEEGKAETGKQKTET